MALKFITLLVAVIVSAIYIHYRINKIARMITWKEEESMKEAKISFGLLILICFFWTTYFFFFT